jgi:hypothetical protein
MVPLPLLGTPRMASTVNVTERRVAPTARRRIVPTADGASVA